MHTPTTTRCIQFDRGVVDTKLYCKTILTFFLCIVACLMLVPKIMAIDTGFSTKNISKEEEDKFISYNDISIVTEEPPKSVISCFDVKENGMYALGHDDGKRKTISIYSADGTFLYGYAFNCDGIFGIEWNNDNINIYFCRDERLAEIDQKGEVVHVVYVESNSENSAYFRKVLSSNKKEIPGKTYVIKNDLSIFDIFSDSRSQLVVETTENKLLFYDASSVQLTNAIVIGALVTVFVSIIVYAVIWNVKKESKKTVECGAF